MATETVIPVKTRTARVRRICDHYLCREPIEPGERYEVHSAPPWRDDNESPYWVTHKIHADLGRGFGVGCEEAAAYREHRAREQAHA